MAQIDIDKGFMELVQLHEREWGTENYVGRPSLADLLSAPVVAMWTVTSQDSKASALHKPALSTRTAPPPVRFALTVHQTVDELNEWALSVILAGKSAPIGYRKLLRLFIGQKPVKVKAVKLIIDK